MAQRLLSMRRLQRLGILLGDAGSLLLRSDARDLRFLLAVYRAPPRDRRPTAGQARAGEGPGWLRARVGLALKGVTTLVSSLVIL